MRLTVEEAKTKRCQEGFAASTGVTDSAYPIFRSEPMAAPAMFGSGGMNVAVQTASAPLHCIGPKCMAWRWDYLSTGAPFTTIDGAHIGHCGKAGPA